MLYFIKPSWRSNMDTHTHKQKKRNPVLGVSESKKGWEMTNLHPSVTLRIPPRRCACCNNATPAHNRAELALQYHDTSFYRFGKILSGCKDSWVQNFRGEIGTFPSWPNVGSFTCVCTHTQTHTCIVLWIVQFIGRVSFGGWWYFTGKLSAPPSAVWPIMRHVLNFPHSSAQLPDVILWIDPAVNNS